MSHRSSSHMVGRWAAWAVPLCVPAALTCAAPAAAQALEANFSIPAQPLPRALISYGEQAGVAIAAPRELTARLTGRAVAGRMTQAEALRNLLAGSGLKFEFIDTRTVRVFREQGAEPIAASDAVSSGAQDIIVTAQKREERLKDVPVAITALTQASLDRSGIKDSADYLAFVPGVSFSGRSFGQNVIVIRGISTTLAGGNEQATTEVLIDDIPSLNRYFSRFNTDLRLVDVERVEVLRGPQGTLFGSGALGGAVRVITNKPDLNASASRVEATLATTKGGDTSNAIEGFVSTPLIQDKVSIRATGYYSNEGGFVDNVFRGENDIDRARVFGGRGTLVARPSDNLNLRVTGIYQRDDYEDAPLTFADRSLGEPDEVDTRKQEGAFDADTIVLNAVAEYDAGPVSIFSSTSYSDRDIFSVTDQTRFYQRTLRFVGDVDSTIAVKNKSVSQELRIQSNRPGPFSWLVGGFYLDQDVTAVYRRTSNDLPRLLRAPSSLISGIDAAAGVIEKAIFADVSYDLTESLTLSAGARAFWNELRFSDLRTGFLGLIPSNPQTSRENSVTPKFSILYRLTDEINMYARAAKGYRTGNVNIGKIPDPVTGFVAPLSYGPDSLWSYEIGAKARLFDGRLSLNAAYYWLDWTDIQLNVRTDTVSYIDNAGDASSEGLELEMVARPWDWIETGVALSVLDARLEKVLPGVSAPVGGRLPGSAELTVSDYVQLTHAFAGEASSYLRFEHRYVGDKLLTIGGVNGPKSEAYHLINARAGVDLGRYELTLFVENLTNDDSSIAPRPLLPGEPAQTIRQRPRTAGLTVRASF